MEALDKLKSVLCDPEGTVCIVGSPADRDIVQRAISDLSALLTPPPDAELREALVRISDLTRCLAVCTRNVATWEEQATKNQHSTEAVARRLIEAEAENSLMGANFEAMMKAGLAQEERAEAAETKSARLGRKLQRLGLHLAETRKKLRKVEAEQDALRERCEKLEWLVEVQNFYMYRLRNSGGWSTPGMERAKIGVAWQHRFASNDELRAMYLAATEVKP